MGFAAGLLSALPAIAQQIAAAPRDPVELGGRIYNEGVLASGAALNGNRPGREAITGAAAACVNCHRPSGMGQVEADLLVPPITGNFLFAAPSDKRIVPMDPRIGKLFNQAHDPYTDATLSQAIREGINNHGRAMNVVMPRFVLSDADLQALTAYLRQLSAQWSPGVTAAEIRFATVITPDVDPQRRKVFIDMMQAVVHQKNGSTVTADQARTRHHMVSAAELVLGTERRWDLQIWELQGAPETWDAQLRERYRSKPVFALVSGLSGAQWQPVHDFCDRERVPCWFPTVDVPPRNTSPYAFYFSAGLNLEAAVLSRHLQSLGTRPKRVVQVYRNDDVGVAAAQALKDALRGSGIAVVDRILDPDRTATDALRQVTATAVQDEAMMFWLRPADIMALGEVKPGPADAYFSAVLAGGERAPLSAEWRQHAHLAYPYELPGKRMKNLDYFHAWLDIRKIPLIDEPMQSEVYFALNFMTDTLSDMLDNLYRDYLVERAETMLSKREGIKAAQETRERVALGRQGDLGSKYAGLPLTQAPGRLQVEGANSRESISQGTTLYPHLSLGAGQRLASKAGYIVRFAHESGTELTAESDLVAP
jgi:cytochrome c553